MAAPLRFIYFFLLLILPSFLHQLPVTGADIPLINNPHLIDQIVRYAAFRSYLSARHKTAVVYNVSLPPNISAVSAWAARFRAGSLRRYGATVDRIRIAPGVVAHPRSQRLIVVVQNLGNLSFVYDGYGNASGFRLVSPVLSLLFYKAASVRNASIPPDLGILVTKNPITVDFDGLVNRSLGSRALCALFDLDGNVSLWNARGGAECRTRRQGHFALVVERGDGQGNAKLSGWKVVVVAVAAGAFSAVLLGLLAVAVGTARRRRLRTAEMQRRAYEAEALQVSMVGHVRAPTAAGVRTAPSLENDEAPPW